MNSRFVFASILKNYQAVVPSTWNAGPRDAHGQRGAYKAALIKTPVADPKRPLELLRTIHSFDPCLACAVHMVGRSWAGPGPCGGLTGGGTWLAVKDLECAICFLQIFRMMAPACMPHDCCRATRECPRV